MPTDRITFDAVFYRAIRKGNSPDGNPVWVLHTSQGSYRTETDSQLGHMVANYVGGGPDSLIGKTVTFTATPRGYVWDMVPSGSDSK